MEIKRQIIESKNPPSNKEVWWFDLNEKQLKRWTGECWDFYNYTWPTIPYHVANNEILVVGENLTENGLNSKNLKTEFSKWETVKEIREEHDDTFDVDLYYVVFEKDLTNVNATSTLAVFMYLMGTPVDIYFPKSLTNINVVSDYLIEGSSEISINMYFSNLQSFSGSFCESGSYYGSIYIYGKTIPQIDSTFIDYYEEGSIDICVPSVLVNKYKQNTNWSQYKFIEID